MSAHLSTLDNTSDVSATIRNQPSAPVPVAPAASVKLDPSEESMDMDIDEIEREKKRKRGEEENTDTVLEEEDIWVRARCKRFPKAKP